MRRIANLPGDPEQGIPAARRGGDLRLLQSLTADAARWEVASADEKARYHATGVDLELYHELAGRRTHSPSGLYDKTVLVLLCELAGGADDLVDPTS